ncbi:MAG: efflux RND transporter periplasmic adaptor subunit [Bacteroidia bacterium]|nr:efflux RND transporter periplasmic adaptor subunit [Bacteroidia bacterium]
MKKNTVYIVAALFTGLLLGYFFFKGEPETHAHEESTTAGMEEVWTCSMHPQIRQPEPGSCPICGMDLILADNGGSGLSEDQFRMTENAMQLANVQTEVVGTAASDGQQMLLSGTIQENEETNTVQVAFFSGRIERLQVNFTGETVRKGTLLGRIYSPELVAAQQELLTASALKESQPQLYDAVKKKLKLWKLTESQIKKIEESGAVMENFPVYATVGGIVEEKLVSEGDYVKQGQPMFKIANLSSVWAVFDAYENQIASLKVGQLIEIRSQAIPNRSFRSKISFIDPMLNSSTRTVEVRTTLQNKDGIFKPGMFVEGQVSVDTGTKSETITIPSSAVLWTGERSVVYLKPNPQEPVFEMQEVQLGSKIGDRYEVIEGLSNGDEIVTNGTFTIDAAAQLKGKKSMMNKSGGKVMTGHEGHGAVISPVSNGSDNDNGFQREWDKLITVYLKLTEALVASDASRALASANTFKKEIANMDIGLIKNTADHDQWMGLIKELDAYVSEIAEKEDLKQQRKNFKPFSATLIEGVEKFGSENTLYSVYCPMADNNTGGYWLSLKDEVINPYFGSAMLNCGIVKKKHN